MKKIKFGKEKGGRCISACGAHDIRPCFYGLRKKTETVTQPAEETAAAPETAGAQATQTGSAQEGAEETGSMQETGNTEESGTFDMASEEIPMAVSGTYDGKLLWMRP